MEFLRSRAPSMTWFFFPSVRPSIHRWENNAYTFKTIRDLWPPRPKWTFQNQNNAYENNAYSSKSIRDNFNQFFIQLYWSIPHTFHFMTFDLQGQIWPLRPKQNFKIVCTLEKTNDDNFTKFYMQLFWLIPHIICLMTFDLQGQIQPLRPKQKFLNCQL